MPIALLGPTGRTDLGAPAYTFGSAPDNQFILPDPRVSPRHATLQLQGQHYSITDLGSIDGTHLNEQRLGPNAPVFLKHGDRIRFGSTVYTYDESQLAAPAYTPAMPASSAPSYAPTGAEPQPSAPPAYGQSNPGFPPYSQTPQQPATSVYDPTAQIPQPPTTPAYGQSDPSFPPDATGGVSSPGYPTDVPTDSNAATAAYAPVPGMPPGYISTTALTKKRNGLMIGSIILVIVLVLGGTGSAFYYLNLPKPILTVTSMYKVGSIYAGAIPLGTNASTTTFTVTGKDFSHNSPITFLLDGTQAPGSSTTQSDGNGNVTAILTVTEHWSIGTHKLAAKDGAGYSTNHNPLTIIIVHAGQAKTPGPNGSPTNSASGTIDVTRQGVTGTLTLTVTGSENGGTVCRTVDNGQPHTLTGVLDDGTTYSGTITSTCSGTYQDGLVDYTETVTSQQITFTSGSLKGAICTAATPYVRIILSGSFTDAIHISNGTVGGDLLAATCQIGSVTQTAIVQAPQGTWTGVANMR